MFHIQNSVFEGEITPAKFQKIKKELKQVIMAEDSVLFFYVYENKKVCKDSLGKQKSISHIII